MIPLKSPLCQASTLPAWQNSLAQALRDPLALLDAVGLTPAQLTEPFSTLVAEQSGFALRVPREYVARMRQGDPTDPLLLQVLPRTAELETHPGFSADPVGDAAAVGSDGLLHKYQGRVLLITTQACPIHCRYCFRRHFAYQDNRLDPAAWQQALDYLHADASIHEVILSGGDPLSLSNERLMAITTALQTIPHLRRLRIHTRMPIVLPQRIDASLLAWLSSLPWQIIVVTHSNHANEIDATVRSAMAQLKATGATLLNQAVLLKGVNDAAESLVDLSEALFAADILPYYLHLLDRVAGAAHFEVDETTARQLHRQLQQRLPGYLVPRLVREIAGEAHKIPIIA